MIPLALETLELLPKELLKQNKIFQYYSGFFQSNIFVRWIMRVEGLFSTIVKK